MEIEFQNDYTINNCLYATPKWTFETLTDNAFKTGELNAVSNLKSINNIPIPNGLTIINTGYIDKPYIYLKNTSFKKKLLTINFNMNFSIYLTACAFAGRTVTGYVRLYYDYNDFNRYTSTPTEIAISNQIIFQGFSNPCFLNLPLNNTSNFTNIILNPGQNLYIYCGFIATYALSGCAPALLITLFCDAQNNPITFFNYVDA